MAKYKYSFNPDTGKLTVRPSTNAEIDTEMQASMLAYQQQPLPCRLTAPANVATCACADGHCVEVEVFQLFGDFK